MKYGTTKTKVRMQLFICFVFIFFCYMWIDGSMPSNIPLVSYVLGNVPRAIFF